jgi:pantoate--beta-alanine ligase
MKLLRTIADLRAHLAPLRTHGPIGLVPTMGALHDGHVSLVRVARLSCAHLVASIFVNPGQFDDPADLAAYPRQEDRDLEIASAAGVDAVFAPPVAEIYPPGDATALVVGGAAEGFEGAFRPGHFNSVANVCLRLFNVVEPGAAYFGQKDAQQVAVIRQTVRDLRLDLRIEVGATVREPDGLALSSRNVRLSPDERRCARAIPRALEAGLDAQARGDDAAAAALARLAESGFHAGAMARDTLQTTALVASRGRHHLDYAGVAVFDGEPTLVVAVRVGSTRLIDNVPLDDPARAGFPIVRRSEP